MFCDTNVNAAVIVTLALFKLNILHIKADLNDYEFAAIRIAPVNVKLHQLLVHVDTSSAHYNLKLYTDKSVFSSDFMFDDGYTQFKHPSGSFYTGKVDDWLNSRVTASIANDRFEAIIFLNDSISSSLFIEDGSRYPEQINCLEDPLNEPDDPHYCTVIYRSSKYSGHQENEATLNRTKRSTNDAKGMCGWANPEVSDRMKKWMISEMVSNNSDKDNQLDYRLLARQRRATAKKVCTLYVQFDSTIWDLYSKDYHGNPTLTRTALTRLAADLVQGMTDIYKRTAFGSYSNFQFQITKIRAYTPEEVSTTQDSIIKRLANKYIDSDAFLRINTEMDHGGYCLAYIVSHRQFSGGVMGLAWLGYPRGYVGGVCQQPTSGLSYNTGIITGNSEGSRVSKRSLMLTLAHEVGHNFGSPHDTTAACTGQGSSGNYIMYPYVNPGTRPNNDDFSSCSKDKITKNLQAVFAGRPGKPNCFKDKFVPICGNQVVEEGEDCDCGETKEECLKANDNCCAPKDEGPHGCRLLSSSKCSPSQGPCCNADTCQFIGAGEKEVCAVATPCSKESQCTDSSAICPAQLAKDEDTLCASSTKMCVKGECLKSICEMINHDECQEPLDKKEDSSRYCYLSCQPRNGNQNCINSLSPDHNMKNLINQFGNGTAIKLPAGSPCDNYRGVCDVLGRCRLVNVQGPISRLFSVLGGHIDANSPGRWLVRYWWVLAIVAVIFIAVSFCLLKYCSDLLPTSNPKFEGKMNIQQAARNMGKSSVRRRPPSVRMS